MEDELAFKFIYADKSSFDIYQNGECFITKPNGKSEKVSGVVINRIPILIANAVHEATK